MPDSFTFDEYFINLCNTLALKAVDQTTRVACVIVNDDNLILSTGYNSFPKGVEDKPERHDRPAKYLWKECSERNAIYNAANVGISLKGSKVYTSFLPCPQCARAIIQAGIKEVIYHKEYTEFVDKSQDNSKKLNSDENTEIAKQMLMEADVKVRSVSVKLQNNKPIKSGVYLDL